MLHNILFFCREEENSWAFQEFRIFSSEFMEKQIFSYIWRVTSQ